MSLCSDQTNASAASVAVKGPSKHNTQQPPSFLGAARASLSLSLSLHSPLSLYSSLFLSSFLPLYLSLTLSLSLSLYSSFTLCLSAASVAVGPARDTTLAATQFEDVAVSSVLLLEPTKTLVTFVTDLCHTLNQ